MPWKALGEWSMTRKDVEKAIGELLAEIYHRLNGKDRAKEFVGDPAIRARLNGQWSVLHTLCTVLKLDMENVQASMTAKLKELAA